MAHHQDVVRLLDQFFQTIGFNPGLNLGALFGGFGFATIKGHFFILTNHRLITTPGQGNIQGGMGQFLGFNNPQNTFRDSDADTEGNRHLFIIFNFPDLIQNFEILFLQSTDFSPFKNHQIAITLVFNHHTAQLFSPLVKLEINLAENG